VEIAVNGQIGTSFVGVLTRREYRPGQRYAQLVFETSEGIKLSLTRNLRAVGAMRIGRSYKIVGIERVIGAKTFITNPVVTLLADTPVAARRRWRVALVAFIVVLVFAGAASAAVMSFITAPPTAAPKASPPSAAVATSKTPTKTATPAATTTPSTDPASTTPAAAAAAKPDCDLVTVPYTNVVQPDPTQPVGSDVITTPGKNGQNKVCYPNGRGNAAVTSVVAAPVTQVTTSGTAVPAGDPPPTGNTPTGDPNAPAPTVPDPNAP